MKKKIIGLIIILIIVVAIILVVTLGKNNNKDNPNLEKQQINEALKYTTEINDTIMKNSSADTLSEVIGTKIDYEDILIGDDSYLRESLSSDLINKYNLSKYVKNQKKYAANVENQIKNNFEYEIVSKEVSIEGDTVISIKFKSYYYAEYLNDLQLIISNLSSMIGYLETSSNIDNPDVVYYKLKVKAMQILDDYLENYINNDNYITRTIIYKKGEPKKSSDSIYSYLLNVKGQSYPQLDYNESKNKIKKYIDTAINNGIIDKNNVLSI